MWLQAVAWISCYHEMQDTVPKRWEGETDKSLLLGVNFNLITNKVYNVSGYHPFMMTAHKFWKKEP